MFSKGRNYLRILKIVASKKEKTKIVLIFYGMLTGCRCITLKLCNTTKKKIVHSFFGT